MKVETFKVLSTLPQAWDYELYKINDNDVVIRKKDKIIIGFSIIGDQLIPMNFEWMTNK